MPRPAADEQPGHGQRPDRVGDGEGHRGGERGRGHGQETSRAGRAGGGRQNGAHPCRLSAASPDSPPGRVPFDPDAELDWSDPAFSRRLLAEHLDQGHDGASRRLPLVEQHVRRLASFSPAPPPAFSTPAAAPGCTRSGWPGSATGSTGSTSVPPSSATPGGRRAPPGYRGSGPLRGGGRPARCRARPGTRRSSSSTTSSRTGPPAGRRPRCAASAACLLPGGRLIAEFRLRPDQLPGRLSAWEVADVVAAREAAPAPAQRQRLRPGPPRLHPAGGGGLRGRQPWRSSRPPAASSTSTSSPGLFAKAGLRIVETFDGWTRHPGGPLCDSVVVVAEADPAARVSTRRAASRPPG